jgi:hypothetical protein
MHVISQGLEDYTKEKLISHIVNVLTNHLEKDKLHNNKTNIQAIN